MARGWQCQRSKLYLADIKECRESSPAPSLIDIPRQSFNNLITRSQGAPSNIEGGTSYSSMPPAPRTTHGSRRNISAQSWEIQRPTITQLYEHGGLQEVMGIMENDHGFLATCAFPSFLSVPTMCFFHETNSLNLGRANTKGRLQNGISAETSGIMRWQL